MQLPAIFDICINNYHFINPPGDISVCLHVYRFNIPCVGRWVVYQEPNYRGAHYILEKRDYNNFSDWGSQNSTVGSMRRVRFS